MEMATVITAIMAMATATMVEVMTTRTIPAMTLAPILAAILAAIPPVVKTILEMAPAIILPVMVPAPILAATLRPTLLERPATILMTEMVKEPAVTLALIQGIFRMATVAVIPTLN